MTIRPLSITSLALGLVLAMPAPPALAQAAAAGQLRSPDVIYVPTPPEVVAAMMKVAKVGPGDVIYDLYDDGSESFGIGPLQDQGLAGTIMMVEGSLVTIGVLAWLFLKLAQEGELRQRLLEEGLDPRVVRRAVRYGRGEELESSR